MAMPDEERSPGQPQVGHRQLGVDRVESDQEGTGGVIPDEEQQSDFSVTEAARASGVDRRTIKRRLDAGEFPNAHRRPTGRGPGTGPWLVPLDDLLAVGLRPDVGRARGHPIRGGPQPPGPELRLRAALADAERRAEVAEALAAERERVIQAQQVALRAFAAGVAEGVDGGPDRADEPDGSDGSDGRGSGGAGAPDETSGHEQIDRPGGDERASRPALVPPPVHPYPEGRRAGTAHRTRGTPKAHATLGSHPCPGASAPMVAAEELKRNCHRTAPTAWHGAGRPGPEGRGPKR